MAGLKALVAAGAAGFAETGGPFFFRSIHRAFPTARYVFIWRGAMDVARSLNRIGAHGDDFVPEGLAAIILRCLQKSPEERFQSAKELLEELDRSQPRNGG